MVANITAELSPQAYPCVFRWLSAVIRTHQLNSRLKNIK